MLVTVTRQQDGDLSAVILGAKSATIDLCLLGAQLWLNSGGEVGKRGTFLLAVLSKRDRKMSGGMMGRVGAVGGNPMRWVALLFAILIGSMLLAVPTLAQTITGQPTNVSIGQGQNASFSVTATDVSVYKWMVNTGSGFVALSDGGVYSGTDTAALAITGATSAMTGYAFRVTLTGSSGSTQSAAATLTVVPPPSITQHPFPATIFAADSVLFYLSAANATSYQWQVDAGTGFSNIANSSVYSGTTSSVLVLNNVPLSMDGYRYRAVVNGIGGAATSNAATLVVLPPPTIASISPAVGSAAGGSQVVITGTNFIDSCQVFFGGESSPAVAFQSSTQITATTPPNWRGAADVMVLCYGFATQYSGFTYAELPGAPSIGGVSAGDGQAVVSFAAPDNGGSAITTYTATASPGTAVGTTVGPGAGSITVTGLDNGTAYTFVVTATNAIGTGAASAASNALTPMGAQSITFNNPGPQNFGTSPTLTASVSSGLAVSFTSATAGVCTITSGGALTFVTPGTCTINADQAGDASYNPALQISQSFTVNAVVPGAPTIVAASAGDTQAMVTFNAPASTGGTAITSYTVTTSPGGATATGASSPLTVTGLTNGATYTFTVTATNSTGTSNASAASNSVTPIPDLPAPIANNVSETVSGNSTSSPITLTITGGAPNSVTVATQASHGIATAAGTSITYTPTAGYSGADSFTYTATNATGTSATATVAITVTAPTFAFSPAAGSLPTGTANTGYSQSVSASGGTSPYSYAATPGALPTGLTLNSSTGTLSGTPTTAGTYNFTVTATDANSATGSASYSIMVNAPVVLTLSPASGALPAGMMGTAFGQTFVASGGTGPYQYVLGGDHPPGMSLAASTGIFSGTPTVATTFNPKVIVIDANLNQETFNFTWAVNQAASFTFAPASGTLPEAMPGEDYHQAIFATGGAAPLIYSRVSGSLPDGMVLNVSTGELTGPLSAGAAVKDYSFAIQVQDSNGATGTATYTIGVKERIVTVPDTQVETPAGSTPTNVDLTKGATGGPFVAADIVSVEPPNAGTVSIVNGEFAQAGPVGPIGWYLKFIPNPAYSGQAKVYFRLTSALGNSNIGIVSFTIGYDAGKVAAEIDTLVHGFVQSRQNLIASTIKVPGLIERQQLANATDPVTARLTPSASGITTTFSTSLVQMEAAANNADGLGEAELSPFNIWIDGTFMLHNRDQNGSKWGSFGMISAGADYLLSEKALVGLSFHYDRMTDPTNADAMLTGNGWLAGPYASFEVGKGVFWDTMLFYGGSSNTIDTAFWDGSYDTRRWLFDTAIKGQWQLGEVTTLTPKLRTVYFSETVQDYAAQNGNGDVLDIRGFTTEQLRVSLGAEIARQFTLENGSTLTSKFGLTGGFAGLKGAGTFGRVSSGLSLETPEAWHLDFGLLFGIEGNGQTSAGAKVGIGARY